MNIAPLPFSLNVEPLRVQLREHPELWNEHRARTAHPRSPHRKTSDIWLRFRELSELNEPERFRETFECSWYPASDALAASKDLTAAICALMGPCELGGVLLTRIPPGACVYPHRDLGWHAEHYAEKIGVLIEGNSRQAFCFENREHRCDPGDAFVFHNQEPHWVENGTDESRITLIVCVRRH